MLERISRIWQNATESQYMSNEVWMSSSQAEEERPRKGAYTLAEMVHFVKSPKLRRELEAFRIAYEEKFGETDLTKRYTSTWPTAQQEWLLEYYPKRYWDGLPPFVQAFLKEKMIGIQKAGTLDDAPHSFLRLYLSRQMQVNDGPNL